MSNKAPAARIAHRVVIDAHKYAAAQLVRELRGATRNADGDTTEWVARAVQWHTYRNNQLVCKWHNTEHAQLAPAGDVPPAGAPAQALFEFADAHYRAMATEPGRVAEAVANASAALWAYGAAIGLVPPAKPAAKRAPAKRKAAAKPAAKPAAK